MSFTTVVSGIGAIAGAFAAYFWLQASLVEVPDNIDTIVGELMRASRLNAYGAVAAVVGSLCAVVLFARQVV